MYKNQRNYNPFPSAVDVWRIWERGGRQWFVNCACLATAEQHLRVKYGASGYLHAEAVTGAQAQQLLTQRRVELVEK